jgi:hypothetical protein
MQSTTAKKARLMGAGLAMLIVLALGAVLALAWPHWRSNDGCAVYRGLKNTVVRFASAEEGRAALLADDEWIAATSDLQRASLMGRAPPASREAFRTWQGDNTQPWSAHERERWCKALESMAPAINAFDLPMPKEILLVNTSGRESADTPHTRGNAIAIPTARFDAQGFSDVEVLAHELFHVITRHAPALATRLYALIGFEAAPELEWPQAWLPLRIADADAPHHRHLMRLTHEGQELAVMPVVIASHAPLQPGEVITAAMEVRLLRVTPGSAGQPTRALLNDGEPLWHEPEELDEFAHKLGQNTDYTIHPEEAMADNFMFLVSGRSVANPALLQRIEAVLKQRAP